MPWMFKKTKRLLLPISSFAFVMSLVALVLAIILGNKNPDKPVTNLKYNDIMQIVGKVCYSTAQNDSLLAQEADATPNKPRNDVSSSEENCNRPLALKSYLDKDYGEHAQNIIVTSECLTLKYSGLYYVYASVHFKPHISHCAMNRTQPLPAGGFREELYDPTEGLSTLTYGVAACGLVAPSHTTVTWQRALGLRCPQVATLQVMRWRVSTKPGLLPHLQTVLLGGVVTCLRSCSEFEKSSFSGRNLLLNVNDTLFVEVSDDSIVNFDKTSSYLGAQRLVENKRFTEQLTNAIDNEEF